MHTGTTAANGSSTIVTDRNGTHPDGYPGFAVVNHASASGAEAAHRHHHRHSAPTPN
jgi:C-terminal processing protease CtpA/Prc